MSIDRELLQKALDSIKCLYYEGQDDSISITDVITEIEAELAKPKHAPMTEQELRALIEREFGPAQSTSDMLWAIEVARAVERVYGITDNAELTRTHSD
jgi:hypothetical protein